MKHCELKRCYIILYILVVMPASVVQASVVVDLPGKVKIMGDFRLRAEYDERTRADGVEQSRNRLRYRARLGVHYQANDRWSAKIRMATNITSINSPHVTFGDDPDTGFDQAWLNYQNANMNIAAGKQPLNYWNSSEMAWDKDFNPDAISYAHQLGAFKLNAAHVILQENSWSGSDNKIEMLQGVYAANEFVAALGYFNVNDGSAAENIITLSGQYKSTGWRTVVELSLSDADVENMAYVLQVRKKLNAEMAVRIYYYSVEAQSIPGDGRYGQDDFPDQNGAGLSNFEGWRIQYDQKIDKDVAMDIRLYSMRAIDDNFAALAGPDSPFFSDRDRIRLQMNVNLKF